ncbi:MAG: ATP-binding protein involved in chromosome partitioning [Bacteroidetes bacterium]|nr:MAG: ATP-binding protein involved in chromosome partitioning [Bacteroidota bacterium]
MSITTAQIIDALRNVDDPDLKKDIVTLGMVRDIAIDGKKVAFTVVLTTPACPMKDMIQRACVNAVKYYVDKEAEVSVTMTANVTTKRSGLVLPNVRNVVAVSSGKGGVGKSTVAANLAAALAMQGARVGLVDADIYGPSIPIMFNVVEEKPKLRMVNGKNLLVPVESYGVKIMSIGFFIESQAQAVVWRGPMAVKAMNQLFGDVDWGELDYMIVDLPPGTGDIHLSLVGSIPVTGAVVVSTPQAVALSDAQKGVSMFRLESVNVPVLGIVENMAWFTPAELPENKYYIFGRDGAKEMAARLSIPLLGQIPLVQSICESGDAGRPAVLQKDTPQAIAFMELAQNIAQQVAIVNAQKTEVTA